jgi:hypothetical protein
MESAFLRRELLQVEANGRCLAHDDTCATSVAGCVGYLARYGHQLTTVDDIEFVPLADIGYSEYSGLERGWRE